MGLVWSDYRKVKNNTMLLTKAVISPDVKDDVWLLWKALKGTPDFEDLKADGFGLGKDEFDGNRWKVLWWYKVHKKSFDEVKGVPKWQRERDQLIQKWILKLAAIKDALADENSDDSDNSFEKSQDVSKSASAESEDEAPVVVKQESDESEDEPKPKPVSKKPSAFKPKIVVKQESKDSAVAKKSSAVVKQEKGDKKSKNE